LDATRTDLAVLRINELKLPLNHPEPALRAAVLARLGIADAELVDFSVFKRSYDARKRSAIVLIYSIDAEVRGKVVRERTVDTFGFWRKRELNPESNVQFGEGGAGTISDALAAAAKKLGNNRCKWVAGMHEAVCCSA
jgi:uncharacterized FAD-dependent dehydrogenase